MWVSTVYSVAIFHHYSSHILPKNTLMIKFLYKFEPHSPNFVSAYSAAFSCSTSLIWLLVWKMFQVFIYLFILSASVTANDSERDYFENEFTLGDERENDRNAMKSAANKWPHGIIPYRFGEGYAERDRAFVLHAMEVFREETCIKFIFKMSNHTEYIRFMKSDSGCGTLVGYKGEKSNPIDVFLSDNCLKKPGAIQHELLHIMGLWHEQSRPDRDDYVEIIWDNIQPS